MERVDFGILTFREDEFKVVLDRFPRRRKISGRHVYNLSRVETFDGTTYRVAVAHISAPMMMGETTEAARELIDKFEVSWLLGVGTARSVYSSTSPADVVISTKILDSEQARFLSSNPGHGLRSHEGAVHREARIALDRLMQEALPFEPQLKFSVASIISQVGQETRFSTKLRKEDQEIVVVGIESVKLYQFTMKRNIPFLDIRGISEVPEYQRRPRLMESAAEAAANFTLAFLKTGYLKPRQASPSRVHARPRPVAQRRTTPVHFKSLSLDSVRGFREMLFALAPSSAEVGQWTLLIGPNGVGKTTLLRALTLALCPTEVVQALLGRLGRSSPMVRLDSQSATIRVQGSDGSLLRLILEAGESGDRLLEPLGQEKMGSPFVVAYGCRRGSALGGAAREVNDVSVLASVETLFDEGASLIHAETWLKERKLAAIQAGQDSKEDTFFRAILDALVKLLPGVEEIDVSAQGVTVRGKAIGHVPLGAMSDGYLTTAGWVLDMVARWVKDARRRDVAVDGDFIKHMVGVAIVDELDLHLHPRWQRDIISTLRGLFPRMSFFVTTHNPLTLLGARKGEIHVLRRDDDTGKITSVQCDLPPGSGAERILTGTWFDLPSTLDAETLGMLEEHRKLLRADRGDSTGAKKLEEELRHRLGSFMDTSLERLAASAAAQVLDEEAGTLTAEERATAHQKLVELLRQERARPKPRSRKSRPKSR